MSLALGTVIWLTIALGTSVASFFVLRSAVKSRQKILYSQQNQW